MSDMFMKMTQEPRSVTFSDDEMEVMARAEAILRDSHEGRLPKKAYGVLFAAEAARIENEVPVGRFTAGVQVADGKIKALETRLGRATEREANSGPVMSFALQIYSKVTGFLLARRRAALRREVAEFVTDHDALKMLTQADPELHKRSEALAVSGVRDMAGGDLGRGGSGRGGDYGSLVWRYVKGMVSGQPREAAWAAAARAQQVRAFVEEPAALARLATTATPDLIKVLRHDIALVQGKESDQEAAQAFKVELLKRDPSVSAGNHYVALRERLATKGEKGLDAMGGMAGLRGFEMALCDLARDVVRGAEELVDVSVRHPRWVGVLVADAQVTGARLDNSRAWAAEAPPVEMAAVQPAGDNTIPFPGRRAAMDPELSAPFRVTRPGDMAGFVAKANAERGVALMVPTSDVTLLPGIGQALKRDAAPALENPALMISIQKTAADASAARAKVALTDEEKAAHDRLELGRRVLTKEAVDRGIMEKQAAEQAKMPMLSKKGQKVALGLEAEEASNALPPRAAKLEQTRQGLANAAMIGSQRGASIAKGVAHTLG